MRRLVGHAALLAAHAELPLAAPRVQLVRLVQHEARVALPTQQPHRLVATVHSRIPGAPHEVAGAVAAAGAASIRLAAAGYWATQHSRQQNKGPPAHSEREAVGGRGAAGVKGEGKAAGGRSQAR